MQITPNINAWLANGERGISSEKIVSHLTGIHVGSAHWHFNHPSDPSDLHRCVLLLAAAPELRAEFHHMAEVSPIWAKLVAEWDDLVALFNEEINQKTGLAPRTFDRMKELGC